MTIIGGPVSRKREDRTPSTPQEWVVKLGSTVLFRGHSKYDAKCFIRDFVPSKGEPANAKDLLQKEKVR